MAQKIHFRQTKQGSTACATQSARNGIVIKNSRSTCATIPDKYVVGPDEFRAAKPEDRCAHCAGLFTERMNARRARTGKPFYKDAFTKELI